MLFKRIMFNMNFIVMLFKDILISDENSPVDRWYRGWGSTILNKLESWFTRNLLGLFKFK
jgi:hypothetical protein